MGLFIGDSQPSKIFVGDTPISKVFLGDIKVRPQQQIVVETYTSGMMNADLSIAKSGFVITQIEMKASGSHPSSGWYWVQNTIKDAPTSSYYFQIYNPFGGQRGYDYGRQDQYGQLRGYNRNTGVTTRILSFNSSWTSKNNFAYDVIISETGIDYKVGQDFGTWNGTGTITATTSNQAFFDDVHGVFTSATPYIHFTNNWSNEVSISNLSYIVTYEKVL